MLPSPAELKYFLEVASSLNLSRTASKIGISQPSLSLAIKRLERSVGAELFIRHQQGVKLTQAGKQLLLHARQLIQDWEKAKTQALASQHEVQGYFTIGCHSTIAIHTVAEFLPELLANNPKLEIQLKHDISPRITDHVNSLSIDIGIVANPIPHPDLVIRKLCNDEVTFWINEKAYHPTRAEKNHPIILCDPNLTQTQSLLKSYKINSSRIIKMNSLEVVAALTAKGAGIGILPARVATSLFPNLLKRIRKSPVYHDKLCLIYRNENRKLFAFQAITHAIKALFVTIQ